SFLKTMNKKKFTYLREIELKYKIKKVESNVIGNVATDPETVVNLFSDLQNETKEKLIAINLDSRNKILCFEVVAIGSVGAIHLRPMEVFRTSILVNAHGIIIIHNHPSGDPKPSQDDIEFTEKLKRISKDLGLFFFDHIIVGIDSYYSFAQDELNQ
ncbi:MAG: JAB domain-containing protein, partial [bacterium]